MLSPNQKATATEKALRLKFAVPDVRGSCFRLSTHTQKLKNEKAGSGSGSPLERKTKVDSLWEIHECQRFLQSAMTKRSRKPSLSY